MCAVHERLVGEVNQDRVRLVPARSDAARDAGPHAELEVLVPNASIGKPVRRLCNLLRAVTRHEHDLARAGLARSPQCMA